MKTFTLSRCGCCGKIKKHGKFQPLDLFSMELIRAHFNEISLVDETCPDCMSVGYCNSICA